MKQKSYNKYIPFGRINISNRKWPDAIIQKAPRWCSVDLRDGNQALINPMTLSEKIELFNLLIKIGFKEIEIGFPSASRAEHAFLRKLIEGNFIPRDVNIQVLCQAREHLIEKSFESLKGAKRAIFHLYNSTSPLQRKIVFQKTKKEIIDLAIHATKLIREFSQKSDTDIIFEYSPESFSATELDFALEICEKVIDIWNPSPGKKMILNLAATVEMATPNVYADQIEWMRENLSRRDSVIISLHAHNDRGTAVAATELAIMAGGDRVEGTLFGNGERTGNVDIINVALNLFSQGINPELDLSDINEVIRVAEKCTRLPVGARHPYAGELVYTAFSGSHQDAISKGMAYNDHKKATAVGKGGSSLIKWEVPYLPIDPIDLGRNYEAIIRINSLSGKGGMAYILAKNHDIELPKAMHPEFSRIIQAKADETEIEIKPEEIWDIFKREYLDINSPFELVKFKSFSSSLENETSCDFILRQSGSELKLQGTGNGPIDSCKRGIINAGLADFKVESYAEHSMGKGSDSRAIAFIEISNEMGLAYFGAGIDTNITLASIKALISALNRSLRK